MQELNSLIMEEENLLLRLAEDRLLSRLFQVGKIYKDQLNYRMDTSRIILEILNFTREEISNRFIPFLKGIESSSSYAVLSYSFQQLLILLSPSVPFISSYLYLKHTSSELIKLDLDHHLQVGLPREQSMLLELPFVIKKSVTSLCESGGANISDMSLKLDLLGE